MSHTLPISCIAGFRCTTLIGGGILGTEVDKILERAPVFISHGVDRSGNNYTAPGSFCYSGH